MSDSGDEDLPTLEIGDPIPVKPYVVTRINVDAEISQDLQRKALKNKISKQKLVFEDETITLPHIPALPEAKICSYPPRRQFFQSERSLKSFNYNSLSIQSLGPSEFTTCSAKNAEEFFSWFTFKIKNSNDELKRNFLLYLWLLMSCHPDQFVVQKCRDVLIEHSSSWRLTNEEVLLIFHNWGVSPRDFISDLDGIEAFLDNSPLVLGDNVENVLHVLNCQLMTHNLEGIQACSKTVFILLTLLTLDQDFICCLSEVHSCLEQLAIYAKLQNSHWIEEYCQALFQVELHHAQISFLMECVVPECMRWCICLAYCQRVFSLEQTFQANAEPQLLQSILSDHFDTFIQLESWELYSLITIVDAGIAKVISFQTEEEIKRGFLDWLNEYMERRIERMSENIDIDATLIVQLVSRLQVEWESTWLQGPSAPDVAQVEMAHEEDSHHSS